MFVPYMADSVGYDATEAALFLASVDLLATANQGLPIGRLSRRYPARRVVEAGVISLLHAVAPLAGTAPLWPGSPARATRGPAVLLAFGALSSFGNGAITVGPTLAARVLVYWSPFIAGALLVVPVAVLLRTGRRAR